MTDEQRERIRVAAMGLADALTAAGENVDVDVRAFDVTAFGDKHRRYAYDIRVIKHSREVIL